MKKQFLAVSAAFAALCAIQLQAGISATSDNFDVNSVTFPSWTSVGAVTTVIEYRATSNFDFDTNDLINAQANVLDGDGVPGNLAGDTEATGDGLLHDGGLRFNTQNATAGDEAIGLTLGGTMSLGEQYTLTMNLYNDNTSFMNGKIQLYDLTSSLVLAETANTAILNNNSTLYIPVTWTLGYTAQAADVGDQLQIRMVENANSTARDGYVDSFSLIVTSVPEPSTFAMVIGGFGMLLLARRRRIGIRSGSEVK